jgi:hypothetical protein
VRFLQTSGFPSEYYGPILYGRFLSLYEEIEKSIKSGELPSSKGIEISVDKDVSEEEKEERVSQCASEHILKLFLDFLESFQSQKQ